MMNNFLKGVLFEDEIEYIYKSLLRNEDVKIQKLEKRYKIKDKNGTEREFDIYYEFIVAGHLHRVAIECKNYKRPISIEIVDQFIGKLKDFNNINGYIISRTGYQRGAAEKAIANGIDLIEYEKLPKFNQILANRISKICLPTDETNGRPFYVIMEKINEKETSGTYYAYEGKSIPLFICKQAAISFLEKLSDKQRWGVFGVSEEQLMFICSLYKFDANVKLCIVPVLGLERETQVLSFEYSGEEIKKAFL